jgi:hypothetical protein
VLSQSRVLDDGLARQDRAAAPAANVPATKSVTIGTCGCNGYRFQRMNALVTFRQRPVTLLFITNFRTHAMNLLNT